MDYEKKYKEALERAKEIKEKIMYSHLSTESCKAVSEYIDTIIPELAESEDERIIRAIIDALYSHTNSINLLSSRGYQMEDIEAYLEKQKKPENTSASTMVPSCWAEEPSLQKEPKPAWSEEDENVYESIQTILLAEARFVEERKWFDSIKARIRSVCWSEEDEKKINFLERLIRYNVPEGEYCWADGPQSGFITKSEAISKLKSLRPSWKPSEMNTNCQGCLYWTGKCKLPKGLDCPERKEEQK